MGDRIRVLIIVNGLAIGEPLGGAEVFGLQLACALDRTRFEPVVCGVWRHNTSSEALWLSQLASRGVEVFLATDWKQSAGLHRYCKAFKGISLCLEQQDFDIIHSNSHFGSVATILLRRKSSFPVTLRTAHLQADKEWGRAFWGRWMFTYWIYPLSFDAETGVSQGVVATLNRRPGAFLSRRPVRLVHNAIDLGRFCSVRASRELLSEWWGIPPDSCVVGSIGALTERKGFRFLLRAAQRTLREIPDAFFLVIGDGELRDELNRLTAELGIAERVVFTGARQDVELLLSLMDVFVLPSLWEGLPTVLMESMAAGVPVVATDIPGTGEVVTHGETGYLVPPQDPAALAAAIVHMLKDREQASLLTEVARREVRARFSIQSIAEQYEELYTDLLSRRERLAKRRWG